MSILVREWLKQLGLYWQTTHEDRLEIDKEIERRTGVDCDTALAQGMISRDEFLSIVYSILRRRRLMEKVV